MHVHEKPLECLAGGQMQDGSRSKVLHPSYPRSWLFFCPTCNAATTLMNSAIPSDIIQESVRSAKARWSS